MKTMLTILMLASASAAFAAEPVVMNDCLRTGAVATPVAAAAGTYDVSATTRWSCDPALVGAGLVKWRINGEPAAEAMAWDGVSQLVLKTTVRADLPLKVCASLAGFDSNGDAAMMAESCTNAIVLATSPGATTEPLPGKPRRGHARR